MKKENPNRSRNTLTDKRFNAVAEFTARASHLKITVDICNYLSVPVTCIKSNRILHSIEPSVNNEIGRALVVKLTVKALQSVVKINAGVDYSEEFITELYSRYKDHSKYRILSEENPRKLYVEHLAWFVFDDRDMQDIGDQIEIPEIGLSIRVGRRTNNIKGTFEGIKQMLSPRLVPENGKRSSGLIVNGVDPNHMFAKMFYRIGKDVFEVDIDRDPEQLPGIHLGVWNRINDLDIPVEQNVIFMTLEEAISGENESGFKVYPSILEAQREGEEPAKKEKEEDKSGAAWEKKDQQAKVSHTWVKVAAEFLKNVLPATVAIAKGILSLVAKIKRVPI